MLIGKYNKSLIITYIGVAFAIIGMNFALCKNLKLSMICMIISGVCDLFDGIVARMCKRTEDEKHFGIEIDSLADMVGFVVFPVIIGYSIGLNNWYDILAYILLVLAGITRLGFFNITVVEKNKDVPVKTYSGLPVTSTSIIIPLIWFISNIIGGFVFKRIYIFIIYLVSILFVLNFKIPKLKGKAYIVVAVIAIIGLGLIVWL